MKIHQNVLFHKLFRRAEIAARIGSTSLNATRLHQIGGPTRTILDPAGVIEFARAVLAASPSHPEGEGRESSGGSADVFQAGLEKAAMSAEEAHAAFGHLAPVPLGASPCTFPNCKGGQCCMNPSNARGVPPNPPQVSSAHTPMEEP